MGQYDEEEKQERFTDYDPHWFRKKEKDMKSLGVSLACREIVNYMERKLPTRHDHNYEKDLECPEMCDLETPYARRITWQSKLERNVVDEAAAREDKTGKVQTVLGLVEPSSLGFVLPHEHLSADFSFLHIPPKETEKHKIHCGWTLPNTSWIRQHPLSHISNLQLSGEATYNQIDKELAHYQRCGGGTVVETTNWGITRGTQWLQGASAKSAVNVVAGTGYNLNGSQNEETLEGNIERMTSRICDEVLIQCHDVMLDDFRYGRLLAGVIGEVATSWPITGFERRSVEAAAEGQLETGAPVILRPGHHREAADEVMRIFTEAGGDSTHTLMSHIDCLPMTQADIMEFSQWQSYIGIDSFGLECSYGVDGDIPSDAQRINLMRGLAQEGLTGRLMMSHDIQTKHRLVHWGGHGYNHITENVIPKMLTRGFTQEMINQITRTNPQQWLMFK